MELPAISPFSIALTEEGSPQFSREPGEGVHYFLGYDAAASRLIEVRAFGSETDLGVLVARSLRERFALAARLFHPGVVSVLESGVAPDGSLYAVTEFADGERLLDYLTRVGTLPRGLGVHLALQLAEVAGYLADFPRLLTTVGLDDFLVTLDRGHRLRLRLGDLGLERPDNPATDSELGTHWIEIVGLLLEHVLDGRELPSAEEFLPISPGRFGLGGAMGPLIERLRWESGTTAIRELRGLKAALLQAAGFSADSSVADLGNIQDVAHRPAGPLSLLVAEAPEVENLLKTKWRIRDDVYPGDGFSPYTVRTRAVRPPSASLEDRGERFDIALLPPERFLANTFAPKLNRQMGHAYLKEHPCLVRTRSMICDADFTLVASPGGNGFSLMEAVTRRGRFSPADAEALLEHLVRLMAHLDGAEIDLDRIDPWRIVFHFDEQLPVERISALAAETPMAEWPAVTTRLRPLPATESLVASQAGSWRHLSRLMQGKNLPALVLWTMEGERFDRLLAENRAAEAPLSEVPGLAELFGKAAAYLDPSNPAHRQRFLEWFHAIAAALPPTAARPVNSNNASSSSYSAGKTDEDAGLVDAEVIPPPEPAKKRWRFGRPLSAA
jgi:hypothetical protein